MNDIVEFDESVYQILRSELDDEYAIEVLKMFLADTSGKFKTLATKIEDRAEMKREAHSIKSSAATFGFVALARLSRELEIGAASLAPAQMLDLAHRMEQVFAETMRFAEANLFAPGSVSA